MKSLISSIVLVLALLPGTVFAAYSFSQQSLNAMTADLNNSNLSMAQVLKKAQQDNPGATLADLTSQMITLQPNLAGIITNAAVTAASQGEQASIVDSAIQAATKAGASVKSVMDNAVYAASQKTGMSPEMVSQNIQASLSASSAQALASQSYAYSAPGTGGTGGAGGTSVGATFTAFGGGTGTGGAGGGAGGGGSSFGGGTPPPCGNPSCT